MTNLLRSIRYEYEKEGAFSLITGAIEHSFVSLLRISPRLYWQTAPKYFRWRCSDDVESYDHPPDPFKIEYVDPSSIERKTGRTDAYRNRRSQFGSVREGDWDRDCDLFKSSSSYEASKAHFEENVPWEETEFIQQRFDEIRRGDDTRYKRPEELLDRYRRFTDLYHTIREEGYRSQKEILAERGGYSDGLYLDTLNEITVDVGRDGELLYVDGFHRLTIAKLLELDEVPVVFLVRHKRWMERRDEICRSEREIQTHSDLRDL